MLLFFLKFLLVSSRLSSYISTALIVTSDFYLWLFLLCHCFKMLSAKWLNSYYAYLNLMKVILFYVAFLRHLSARVCFFSNSNVFDFGERVQLIIVMCARTIHSLLSYFPRNLCWTDSWSAFDNMWPQMRRSQRCWRSKLFCLHIHTHTHQHR